jgi:hypothetical protein
VRASTDHELLPHASEWTEGASYGLPIPRHSIPFGAAGDVTAGQQLQGAGRTPILEFLQQLSKNLDLPLPDMSSSSYHTSSSGVSDVGDGTNRGRSWRVVQCSRVLAHGSTRQS